MANDSQPQPCSSCSSPGCGDGRSEGTPPQSAEKRELVARMSAIPTKILVFSGKGGVGKSTVAANLAAGIAARGGKVGVLDIDFHGPSIPMLFGLHDRKTGMRRGRIAPVEPTPNLRIMSLGFLVENPDDAVIWRGPMKMGVIEQLLRDVDWGDTEFLIIDSPPGTGDEPLSVCQLVPDATGGVLVTTPQQLSVADVRRSIRFCRRLSLPVLGVVENMSGFLCPHCGRESPVFKEGGGASLAREAEVPFLGRIPLDQRVMEAGDSGTPFVQTAGGATGRAFEAVIDAVLEPMQKSPTTGAAGAVSPSRFAVPLSGGKLADHFGHCDEFAIVEAEGNGDRRRLRTTMHAPPPHEPGVLPQWLYEKGVRMVLAAGMGTRAQELFSKQGMQVATGVPPDAPEALVNAFLDGQLSSGDNQCTH